MLIVVSLIYTAYLGGFDGNFIWNRIGAGRKLNYYIANASLDLIPNIWIYVLFLSCLIKLFLTIHCRVLQ